MINYAIQAYGFLIPLGKTVTGKEFSNLILSVYDELNDRNSAVAKSVEGLNSIERKFTGNFKIA